MEKAAIKCDIYGCNKDSYVSISVDLHLIYRDKLLVCEEHLTALLASVNITDYDAEQSGKIGLTYTGEIEIRNVNRDSIKENQ